MPAILFPMLREKQGRIIVVFSTSGQIGQAGQVNYSASKAGLIGAAKALAVFCLWRLLGLPFFLFYKRKKE